MRQQPPHHENTQLTNEFISLISHELRTPLTSIKGSLGLILGGACGQLDERLRDLLTAAYTNSDRSVKLINDVQDLWEIEAGQYRMRFESVDLTQMVEESVAEISAFAQQQGILIVSSLTDRLPQVRADSEQLQRVLMNLLSNALKFSPPGSQVVVAAEPHDGWVTVSVKDHGFGITLEDQQRLFDKLHQLRSSASRNQGGTGLALSICKAIIEQHGGTIGVESAPGQGSRFFLSLPAIETAAASQPVEHALRQVAATGTRGAVWCAPAISQPPQVPFVLMVDDDPGLRKVVARIVQHSGHQVETAVDGEEAIEKINRLHPDLVILDILMPVLSGFGVVQTLKRQPETRDLPLLVLTTKDLSEAEKDALRLGPTKFVTKSLVTVESLTSAMNELLQQRQEGSEVLA
jgi:CheY-like chemotaxis protein